MLFILLIMHFLFKPSTSIIQIQHCFPLANSQTTLHTSTLCQRGTMSDTRNKSTSTSVPRTYMRVVTFWRENEIKSRKYNRYSRLQSKPITNLNDNMNIITSLEQHTILRVEPNQQSDPMKSNKKLN